MITPVLSFDCQRRLAESSEVILAGCAVLVVLWCCWCMWEQSSSSLCAWARCDHFWLWLKTEYVAPPNRVWLVDRYKYIYLCHCHSGNIFWISKKNEFVTKIDLVENYGTTWSRTGFYSIFNTVDRIKYDIHNSNSSAQRDLIILNI